MGSSLSISFRILVLLLSFPFCSLALAGDFEFRIGLLGEVSVKDRLVLHARPGEIVYLSAGFYEPGDNLRPLLNEPEGSYQWKVRCGLDAREECPEDLLLIPEEQGQSLHLPASNFREMEVQVAFVKTDGNEFRGTFSLKNSEIFPPEASKPESDEKENLGKKKAPHSAQRPGPVIVPRVPPPSPQLKQKRNASVSSTGGFTASGAGNSGREKKTGKRRKIFSEPDRTSLSSQEHAFWDYGYTAPAPALRSESPMQRGENRGDSAPVLSCASLRSQNGKIEVRCEDSKKELRILRAANLAKPVKRSGQILLKPQKAPRPLVPKNTKMKKAGESSGKRKQTGKGLEKNPTWRAEQSR